MKFKSLFKKATLFVATAVLASVSLAGTASAIPFTADTPGTANPAFNVYTGVPTIGDEKDFLRGKEETATGYINDVNSACTNGTRFLLRVYVHNSANQTQNNNGNGPSVAHGSKVRVALPSENTNASKFNLNSVISATNVSSVSDGMSINCGNKVVKLNYVKGSAKQFTVPGGTQALSDNIVSSGAAIGTQSPNGDVWGCFDQRVWVTLVVEVKEAPKTCEELGTCPKTCEELGTCPKTCEELGTCPKDSKGVCKAITVKTFDGRKVEASVTGTVDNAEIVGYKIAWGDGSESNKQSDSHTYAADGTYTITASVQIKTADGKTEWKTATDCATKVVFKGDEPPKVIPPEKPTQLPVTGPAGVAAIFTGVSAFSAVAHNLIVRRRAL